MFRDIKDKIEHFKKELETKKFSKWVEIKILKNRIIENKASNIEVISKLEDNTEENVE